MVTMIRETVAANLRLCMDALGWTFRDFQRAADIPDKTLRRYVAGEVTPVLDILAEAVHAFHKAGLPVDLPIILKPLRCACGEPATGFDAESGRFVCPDDYLDTVASAATVKE